MDAQDTSILAAAAHDLSEHAARRWSPATSACILTPLRVIGSCQECKIESNPERDFARTFSYWKRLFSWTGRRLEENDAGVLGLREGEGRQYRPHRAPHYIWKGSGSKTDAILFCTVPIFPSATRDREPGCAAQINVSPFVSWGSNCLARVLGHQIWVGLTKMGALKDTSGCTSRDTPSVKAC